MAATAGRSRLLVLSRSVAGLTAGFPGLVVSRQRPHRTVHQRLPAWLSQKVAFCSAASPSDDVTVVYQNGFPVITVNLPSRQEKCRFTLKPISDSVGVFLQQLQNEDRGIDRVAIYSTDGSRVASSTGIDVLLLDDFKLSINDKIYDVRAPKRELLSHEHASTMNDVKHLVQQLHTSMHIKDFQVNREKELCSRLEQLQGQLEPHEKARIKAAQKAAKLTRVVQWGGLAYMSVQFGILARLTWWEYSWDIMEPVTYFITYSGIIGMYCYFLLTGKEYLYPDATDRQYLHYFHKTAKKTGFNYLEYNRLKDDIAQDLYRAMSTDKPKIQSWYDSLALPKLTAEHKAFLEDPISEEEVELDLKRLRDPLQMHLPIQQIDDKARSLQDS